MALNMRSSSSKPSWHHHQRCQLKKTPQTAGFSLTALPPARTPLQRGKGGCGVFWLIIAAAGCVKVCILCCFCCCSPCSPCIPLRVLLGWGRGGTGETVPLGAPAETTWPETCWWHQLDPMLASMPHHSYPLGLLAFCSGCLNFFLLPHYKCQEDFGFRRCSEGPSKGQNDPITQGLPDNPQKSISCRLEKLKKSGLC